MTALKYAYRHIGTVVIDSVPDEHEEQRDYELSFWWNNKRYYLNDFIRVHNNPPHHPSTSLTKKYKTELTRLMNSLNA